MIFFTRYNLIKFFWHAADTPKELWSLLNNALKEYPLLDDVFLSIATVREVLDNKDESLLTEWINTN